MESTSYTPSQIQSLRTRLTELITEYRSLVATSAQHTGAVELDGSIGRVTRIDAIQQQSMAKATHQTNLARLKKLESTLERLDTASFGECHECGEPISFKRLMIQPDSTLCIECKEERS